MVNRKHQRDQHDAETLTVRATWSVGARSTAWDRLWRVILSDLGPIPADGLHERIESEGDDA